jgi:mycofactocin system transcriptional regulator
VQADGYRRRRGRPPTQSGADLSRRALELLATKGFEQTTVGDLAKELAVSRRTLFRYFPSKNDIVWGDFDAVLTRLERELDDSPLDEPMSIVLTNAVIESNRYPAADLRELRIRMTLITRVPDLQAHSMVRYAAWRRVVADFAATRLGLQSDDLLPIALGYVALGASIAAFARWVDHPDENLENTLRRAYAIVADGLRDIEQQASSPGSRVAWSR